MPPGKASGRAEGDSSSPSAPRGVCHSEAKSRGVSLAQLTCLLGRRVEVREEIPHRLRRLGALCHSEAARPRSLPGAIDLPPGEASGRAEGDSSSPSAPRGVCHSEAKSRGVSLAQLTCLLRGRVEGREEIPRRPAGASERYVTPRLKAEESPLRSSHASWGRKPQDGRRFLVAFGSSE